MRKTRFWVVVLLAIESLFAFYFFSQHYMVGGHDGFEHFLAKYFCLNGLVSSGEIPLWNPYLTQGTVAAGYNYANMTGPVHNAIFFFSPWLKQVAFYWIHHAQFFLEEIVLLIGAWMWCGCYCRSPLSRFFFSATIVATDIWFLQPYTNHHFILFLPLTFYFLHLSFKRGSVVFLTIAVQFLLLTVFGGAVYFLPALGFLFCLYAFGLVLRYRGLRFCPTSPWIVTLCAVSILFILALFWIVFVDPSRAIVVFKPGRALDGATSLSNFLTLYADRPVPIRWLELILGF